MVKKKYNALIAIIGVYVVRESFLYKKLNLSLVVKNIVTTFTLSN